MGQWFQPEEKAPTGRRPLRGLLFGVASKKPEQAQLFTRLLEGLHQQVGAPPVFAAKTYNL